MIDFYKEYLEVEQALMFGYDIPIKHIKIMTWINGYYMHIDYTLKSKNIPISIIYLMLESLDLYIKSKAKKLSQGII